MRSVRSNTLYARDEGGARRRGAEVVVEEEEEEEETHGRPERFPWATQDRYDTR